MPRRFRRVNLPSFSVAVFIDEWSKSLVEIPRRCAHGQAAHSARESCGAGGRCAWRRLWRYRHLAALCNRPDFSRFRWRRTNARQCAWRDLAGDLDDHAHRRGQICAARPSPWSAVTRRRISARPRTAMAAHSSPIRRSPAADHLVPPMPGLVRAAKASPARRAPAPPCIPAATIGMLARRRHQRCRYNNWRDYGRSRWQLCNHVTNLAECLKRGWRPLPHRT
jgi:hypothetical protein